MAELRDRLAKWQQEREAQQTWFQSWFDQSPWLTTLISSLMGPVITLSLILIFGPCILNKLVAFVKDRLQQVNVMFLDR
ncbi:ENV1 protein, partial [Nicator chloris]|nr:ENV1 protein [Nicator chloris]